MLLASQSVHRWQRRSAVHPCLLLALAGGVLALAPAAHAQQKDQPKNAMPGMDMSGTNDMGDMGPSMAAMAGHMHVTPLRPMQPGDEEKVKAVVAQVKASIERYKDYRKALADGYVMPTRKWISPSFIS